MGNVGLNCSVWTFLAERRKFVQVSNAAQSFRRVSGIMI